MPANNISNLAQFIGNWKANEKYFEMLSLLASLSKLFSDNSVPFIDYRIAENLFCKYYNALNDARSCTAYDARINNIGIGIKTFILTSNNSIEKIAEFNKLRPQLIKLSGLDLARKLGEFRNNRMDASDNIYNVSEQQYHIVGRKSGLLRIFNTPYQRVQIDNIRDVIETTASLSFNDGLNEYSFNKSKTVLQKRFYEPTSQSDYMDVPVQILDDPLALLEEVLGESQNSYSQRSSLKVKGLHYVVLPLYSVRDQCVQERAGLNQWNANGRPRHEDEVYIPVPAKIHRLYPDFFPQNRDTTFNIKLPNGTILNAKMCQSGLKGLMSNPNKELGHWILRNVLRKSPGELVTMNDLYRAGIDSLYVEKLPINDEHPTLTYSLSFSNDYERYESFVEE